MRSKCIQCDNIYSDTQLYQEKVPTCSKCQSLIRPDVVWFGEALPVDALKQSQKLAANCQVFLSIGTSGLVEPAASLPFLARENGAWVIEINKNKTPLTPYAHEFIEESAEMLLPEIAANLLNNNPKLN